MMTHKIYENYHLNKFNLGTEQELKFYHFCYDSMFLLLSISESYSKIN